MSAELHSIELQPTDKQLGEGYAKRMHDALEAICAIENEAMADGFAFNYAVAMNGFGRKAVQSVAVLKVVA